MRGGVQDAPKFAYPDWLVYVFTSSASHQLMASAIFLGLTTAGYLITVRGMYKRKWNFVWLSFSLGVLIPLWACWVPYINTTELTSLARPQWMAVCLACSLAQLVFGWQAWLLRSNSTREAIEGSRSGLVFLLITLSTQSVLILLRYLDKDWQSAVNGQLWALLGSAQLIVAFTAGIGERKSMENEVMFRTMLNKVRRQPVNRGRPHVHRSVWRASRTPANLSAAGRFIRISAHRMGREHRNPDTFKTGSKWRRGRSGHSAEHLATTSTYSRKTARRQAPGTEAGGG